MFERVTKRKPNFIIGETENPYLFRWWIIPRNKFFNIYLHQFKRSDDARALHDHPWLNCSVILKGSYTEHTIKAGGVNYRRVFSAGDFKFRHAKYAHRIELHADECFSLFITGPVIREWGFHCEKGWVHWKKFTDTHKGQAFRGPGCDAS